MERKDHIDAFGAIALIIFSLSLGLNQALVKIVNEGMAPIFQAGMRSLVAFPIVMLFAFVASRRLSITDGSLIPGIITGIFFAAEFMLLFQAVEYTSIARVSILFYTMPIWVAVGAHFLIPGDRLHRWKVLGLVLAIAGVGLALSLNAGKTGEQAFIGDMMALTGSTFWAAIALIARTTKFSRAKPEMQLIYQLVVSAPIMLAVAAVDGDMFRQMTYTHLWIFLFQSLVIVGVGFAVWFWILSIYPASSMASFAFLAPVFGVFFGWLIFAEPLTPVILGALVLVAAGIVLVNRPAPG
ncbi:MAG: DMT family transporter [Pseudomonadota bacterium]